MTRASGVEITGVGASAQTVGLVRRRLTAELDRLSVTPVHGHVTFFDDNGPKGGPASRCAITVRLPYRPSVRVEHVATTPRLAFDGAFEALGRRLEKYRERQRDIRRRPKKYYAAKRLLS